MHFRKGSLTEVQSQITTKDMDDLCMFTFQMASVPGCHSCVHCAPDSLKTMEHLFSLFEVGPISSKQPLVLSAKMRWSLKSEMTGSLHWQFGFNNYTTCFWTKHSQQHLSEKCFHYRVVIVQSSIPSPKSRNTNGLKIKCRTLIKFILMKEVELPSTFFG